MYKIGIFAVPIIIFVIIFVGLLRKQKVFSQFSSGAKEGLKTVFSITPTLIGLVTAVSMFKSSGVLDLLMNFIEPITDFLGIPKEIMPIVLLRPVSGSGTLSMLNVTLKDFGPDSFIGRVASVLCASTDTTFYAAAVYFGSIGIKNIRHTLSCSIIADIVSAIMSILTVSLILS
ncbi:MAG: spore maturation protein [Acutalibacteraceae bacterium]|nr:spore maturation protein [Acutalibacteraceae bacterium]